MSKSPRVALVLCLAAMLPTSQAQVVKGTVTMATTTIAVVTLGPIVSTVEALQFSGSAVIKSRMVPDPAFGKPSLILLFDMSGVSGRSRSGLLFQALSQQYVIRPHQPTQNVEFTFPLAILPAAPLSLVLTANARFALNVDLGTGAITSVAATVAPR